MDLVELKRLHDKAYSNGQQPREQASDDLVFYWVTQWDDNILGSTQLQYRGEFDILKRAGRQIMSDLAGNPVSIDFDPKDQSRDDGAELLDGIYRSVERVNTSIEAFDNAAQETVVCGVGAWYLHSEYESTKNGNSNQVIKRTPLYEACNTVFWDPNAKLLDKSDADYVSVLHAYSHDGYKDLVEELTGERPGGVGTDTSGEGTSTGGPSFAAPEESYAFPWFAETDKVHIVDFYVRELIKDEVLSVTDIFGNPAQFLKSQTEDIETLGYQIVETKKIERYQVTKYIASGEEILLEEIIVGEFLPVVPVYGERAFIEDVEYYEGITRLAKDPQRLRNFQMSYLADIVSRSPRPKPIFFAEQIQGFESMYEENGADNNFPYLLQNRKDTNNEELPGGPAGQMPEQQIPMALMTSIELSRQAVEDVANPGLPESIADPDSSGKAIALLQSRLDNQSITFQNHLKHAKRRDAVIFASMATEVYDAPRTITSTSADGTRKQVKVMEILPDGRVLNDLTNMEFEVYADVGPSFTTVKEQTMDRIKETISSIAPINPRMAEMLTYKLLSMEDGVSMDDIKDYARKQLVLQGFTPPETPEEQQLVQQAAQQQGEPDAIMVAAQAEMGKAQAAQMREQRQLQKDASDYETKTIANQIDWYEAQTERGEVMFKAKATGVDINKKLVETRGVQIDNAQKLGDAFRARVGGQR